MTNNNVNKLIIIFSFLASCKAGWSLSKRYNRLKSKNLIINII